MLPLGKLLKKPTANSEVAKVLGHHEQLLGEECRKAFQEIVQITAKLEKGWEEHFQRAAEFIQKIGQAREALQDISKRSSGTATEPIPDQPIRFMASSLFLRECHQFLSSDSSRHERLHLVTGPETPDHLKILSRIEHVKLEKKSSAYVSAEGADAHMKFISLEEKHGHHVLGMFHSHIAQGANSTHPSGTDIAFQDRLAKLECPAIGGIFSMDGYVRFFSTWKPFEIDVYGKGVKRVDDQPMEKVFQIQE